MGVAGIDTDEVSTNILQKNRGLSDQKDRGVQKWVYL